LHRIVDVMSRPPKDQELVVAYGFDQVGLRIPSPVERPEYRIEFVQYGSSELGTNAGGIIFPSSMSSTTTPLLVVAVQKSVAIVRSSSASSDT